MPISPPRCAIFAGMDAINEKTGTTPRPGFPGAPVQRIVLHPLARARAPIQPVAASKASQVQASDAEVFDNLPVTEQKALSEAGHVKDGRRWRVPKAVRLELFLYRIAHGATDAEAAAAAGYPPAAVLEWMRDSVFVERYNAAKASGYSVEALLEAAMQKALAGSDKMLEFLLCNLMPDRFRKTDRAEVQVQINLAERITNARRRAR